MTTESPELGRVRRLLQSDTFVTTAATVVATGSAFLLTTLAFTYLDLPPRTRWLWMPSLTTWTLLSGLHGLLTWLGHRGLGGERLTAAARLQGSPAPQRRRWRASSLTEPSDAPGWSVTMASLAILVVGALVLTPSLRDTALLLALAVALVVVSWVDVVMCFAVQYARTDAWEPSFTFPGDEERHFDDYLYLALVAQTSLSMSDVQIRTRRMRRTVSTQLAVAFLFNTVLVAMAVSLVISRL